MNERIRELWSQAEEEIKAEYEDESRRNRRLYNEIFLPKFAELIVQECAEVCHKMAEDSDSYVVHDGDTCAEQIKQHFGVESTSIKVGSRVKVVSGFNVGAKGTVSYIEPTGRMWVMRDGASTDVFYTPDEVVRIEQ